MVSGGIVVSFSLPQSAVWQSTTATVSSLSGGWQSVYSLVNSVTAGTFYLNNVSLVGNLSSTYVYGASNETVLSDGSNMYGNGTNTITLNYLSGVYTSSPIYTPTISAVNIIGNQIKYSSNNVLKVYQYYNSSTNSFDTVFV